MQDFAVELAHRTFEQLAQWSEFDRGRVSTAQAALTFYSTDGYLRVNSAFRRVHSGIPCLEEDKRLVSTFMYAVEPAVIELPFDIVVYRGVGRTEGNRLLECLEQVQSPAYPFPVSTTTDERVGWRFAQCFERGNREYEVLLELTLPAGTRIVALEPFSAYPDECELLVLPRVQVRVERVIEYPLQRTVRVLGIVEQELLPVQGEVIDQELLWHWSLCTGVDTDAEEDNVCSV